MSDHYQSTFTLRVRGDGLAPGDYLEGNKATVVHAYNDLGVVRIKLDQPNKNGNDNISVSADRTFTVSRVVTIQVHDGDDS